MGFTRRTFFAILRRKIYINCIDGNSSLLIQRTPAHTLSMFEAFWSFISVMIDAEQGEKLSKDEKASPESLRRLFTEQKQIFSIVSLFASIVVQKPTSHGIRRLKLRKIWIFYYGCDDGRTLLTSGAHCICHGRKTLPYLRLLLFNSSPLLGAQIQTQTKDLLVNDCELFLPAYPALICLLPETTNIPPSICVKHDNQRATKIPWEHNKE